MPYAWETKPSAQATTQTWMMWPDTPTVQRMLIAPDAYGWVVAPSSQGQPCPHCHAYGHADCQAVAR
jgi:hypothetical protein